MSTQIINDPTEVVSLRIPKSLKERVRRRAYQECRTQNAMFEALVHLGLKVPSQSIVEASDSLTVAHAMRDLSPSL